jgi:hypothetical protein
VLANIRSANLSNHVEESMRRSQPDTDVRYSDSAHKASEACSVASFPPSEGASDVCQNQAATTGGGNTFGARDWNPPQASCRQSSPKGKSRRGEAVGPFFVASRAFA